MSDKKNVVSVNIPLQYVYTELLDNGGTPFNNDDGTPIKNVSRLGIWTIVNDGDPLRALFDTGSDPFNTQLTPKTSGVKITGSTPKDKYIYAYGDGTYGDLIQKVTVNKLLYCSHKDIDAEGKLKKTAKPVALPQHKGGDYILGRIEAYLFREDYYQTKTLSIENFKKNGIVNDAPEHVINVGMYEDIYGSKTDKKYYIDLHAKKLIEEGKPGDERSTLSNEEGMFSGCYGAGDYLTPKTSMGLLGGATTSGYIVSANGNSDFYAQDSLPEGCSPCVIVHLNDSLRAQFTSFMPWHVQRDDTSHQETFPGSGTPASAEYEGGYTLRFQNPETKRTTQLDNVTALLDTGYGINGNLTLNAGKFDELKSAGYLQQDKELGTYQLDNLVVWAPSGKEVTLSKVSVRRDEDVKDAQGVSTPAENQLSVGLDFFLAHSVMYDLEHKTTAYTRHFVSLHPFNTGHVESEHREITWRMGSAHPMVDENGVPMQVPVKSSNGNVALVNVMGGYMGIANVMTGRGGLVIRDYAVACLSARNTYEGETHVEKHGVLELAGPGRVEHSARLVIHGVLDISQAGAFRPEWGMGSAAPEVMIRDLHGQGRVVMGKSKLVLTQGAGAFNGVLVGAADAGELVIGLQSQLSLGGRNTFAGHTEVSHGATLHITETGTLQGKITVRGKLIVDGHVAGTIILEKDAVLSGRGVVDKVINNGGQNLIHISQRYPFQRRS